LTLLTPEQRARFNERGYLLYGPLITPDEAADLRATFEALTHRWAAEVEATTEEYLEVISQWTNVWEQHPRFRQQLFHARAAAIAAELIDCERVRVFHDHIIAKPPRGGGTIPWHRDFPNWPIDTPRALSCWLALDDVDTGSGAMSLMPGTNSDPMTPSIDFLNESKDWGERAAEAESVSVPAGWAVFHHCLTWHNSPPNHSDRWRRAYITILMDAALPYQPGDASWHPMSKRVTAPAGAPFNAALFPVVGGREVTA